MEIINNHKVNNHLIHHIMTESSSFSSLMALVDSHLSRTGVQGSRSEDGGSAASATRIPMAPPHGGQIGTLSDTLLCVPPNCGRLPVALPSFSLGTSPDASIKSVLGEQVANMLKAKELRRQRAHEDEERRRLAEEMRSMSLRDRDQGDDCLIDLMQALQSPCQAHGSPAKLDALSASSSSESLFEPRFIDCEDILAVPKTPEPLLPCTTDLSSILNQKVQKAKCSAFGKVLTSRLRPVAAPYLFNNINNSIKRFDFATKSPCDTIKDKLRRPTCYNVSNNVP